MFIFVKIKHMYIYALLDPMSHEIRYIGKTNNIIERYRNHIREKSNCHRVNWISSLKKKNLIPSFIILQECEDNESDVVERQYIKEYREKGYDLTNNTDGGDGNYKFTPDVIEKLSRQRVGKKQSAETIAKRVQHLHKSVLQYDLEGNFIKKWDSIKSAAEAFNISYQNITAAISGKYRMAANYQWSLDSENFVTKIDSVRKVERPTKRRAVLYYDNFGNVTQFSSIGEASEILKTSYSFISKSLTKNKKSKKYGRFEYLKPV